MKQIVLRAKLRMWSDSDIDACLRKLNLKQGEMSHLVRESVRKELVERGVMDDKRSVDKND